ncbi:Hypothetical predicted protein [Pelobates cultripes]|uniref:Endonuclease/exonuclease/phosphatase domain-containing protein n=1 Tax=Pelobates cultripes TaxID=61616 RepID=A0AAD1SX08_PELCU|nr:Hypothetical predicted protein [Pelobates cultripes]
MVFLQETHFHQGDAPKLGNKRYPLGYYANHPEAKKAGEAILFASNVADFTYTFTCLYGPNRRQHTFIGQTLAKLGRFREGLLVVAGDLNLPLDPRLDSSRGVSMIPTHCLRATLR